MAHRFTREELYELVWSQPMRKLAGNYGMSDVGLSKACRRSSIPVPERGYWAKRRAGKKVSRRPLPPRGPGMADHIVVGERNRWAHLQLPTDREVLESSPVAPVFERDIEDVVAEARAAVGRVAVSKGLLPPHHLVAQLLDEDEERRQKAAKDRHVLSWNRSLFDSPFERRRLRLINAIFVALSRQGMRPAVAGRHARDLGVQVNDQYVTLDLDDAKAKPVQYPTEYEAPTKPSGRMRIGIRSWRSSGGVRCSWEDAKDDPVEKHATDVVTELIAAGERKHREAAQRRHECLVRRKEALLEAARRREEEERQRELERLARLEQERVAKLLADAAALRQAADIREYVSRVRELCASRPGSVTDHELSTWEKWALAQADCVDPVVSGRFHTSVKDSNECSR